MFQADGYPGASRIPRSKAAPSPALPEVGGKVCLKQAGPTGRSDPDARVEQLEVGDFGRGPIALFTDPGPSPAQAWRRLTYDEAEEPAYEGSDGDDARGDPWAVIGEPAATASSAADIQPLTSRTADPSPVSPPAVQVLPRRSGKVRPTKASSMSILRSHGIHRRAKAIAQAEAQRQRAVDERKAAAAAKARERESLALRGGAGCNVLARGRCAAGQGPSPPQSPGGLDEGGPRALPTPRRSHRVSGAPEDPWSFVGSAVRKEAKHLQAAGGRMQPRQASFAAGAGRVGAGEPTAPHPVAAASRGPDAPEPSRGSEESAADSPLVLGDGGESESVTTESARDMALRGEAPAAAGMPSDWHEPVASPAWALPCGALPRSWMTAPKASTRRVFAQSPALRDHFEQSCGSVPSPGAERPVRASRTHPVGAPTSLQSSLDLSWDVLGEAVAELEGAGAARGAVPLSSGGKSDPAARRDAYSALVKAGSAGGHPSTAAQHAARGVAKAPVTRGRAPKSFCARGRHQRLRHRGIVEPAIGSPRLPLDPAMRRIAITEADAAYTSPTEQRRRRRLARLMRTEPSSAWEAASRPSRIRRSPRDSSPWHMLGVDA